MVLSFVVSRAGLAQFCFVSFAFSVVRLLIWLPWHFIIIMIHILLRVVVAVVITI